MPDEVVSSSSPEPSSPADQARADQDRREFLEKCGKFAAITPPAMTFLLSTALNSKVIAASSGSASGPRGNPGNNKPVGHSGEGPPNDSRFEKFGYKSSTGTGGSRGASDGNGGVGGGSNKGGGPKK